ncbi:hypothetical protein QWJ34_17315 [Saccharibacillus sp. CPCC 101409]|uniref:hypothetical protein n=1 Tax=Saccharibacillus sp. CPCC 101409 TaxID=3058041 RepID=UPI002673115D|nr:hypothetical protein [Saccharibacillus sp. CPCC 101409]MDO3411528.1 hypothetical protein [Saccharibacillus sp. CPCC 101409]
MFGLSDLVSLVVSAFIILPVVVFLRECGYLLGSFVFGVRNPRITLGSGPRLFKLGIVDVRRYYHLYSWFSHDEIKRESRLAYVCLYAGPILVNLALAFAINMLLADGTIQWQRTFWDRLVFYAFYYALFDIVPMKTTNGKPNNGMIIYEMLRYGRRTDYNHEPFLPSTSESEERYLEEMEAYRKNAEQNPILQRKRERKARQIRRLKHVRQQSKRTGQRYLFKDKKDR